jgi:hypothetical protein
VTLPVLDLKVPVLHDRADPLDGREDVRGAVPGLVGPIC